MTVEFVDGLVSLTKNFFRLNDRSKEDGLIDEVEGIVVELSKLIVLATEFDNESISNCVSDSKNSHVAELEPDNNCSLLCC